MGRDRMSGSTHFEYRIAVENLAWLRHWSSDYRKIVLRHHTGKDNLGDFAKEDFIRLFQGIGVQPHEVNQQAEAKRKAVAEKRYMRKGGSA